ncbi:hypothetical protein L6452_19050 [Arctium lappa]|uniref:Uncharacterized protein n=1 Tax=Arctium lappa TaxID=4217 RepID=A0ACB9B6U3_ARCLA|nr:hypothetical protein L6452_19050 [Arctium lappa]
MMWRWSGGLRYLFLLAAIAFIYTQVRLFKAQSEYADKVAAALIAILVFLFHWERKKIHIQPSSSATAVSEQAKRQEEECEQLRTLLQNLERKGVKGMFQQAQVPVAAVVIMACNRADYLERTIKSILKYHGSVASKFPVFVSQDGSNSDVRTKALSYNELTYMQHLDYEPVHTERPGELIAYYKIARHYKWALDQLFYKHNFKRVIILEDDMEIAPDFFDFFEAGADLLDKDKSIMAISSWNDNGQKQFVHDPYTLYRSDFFPGLGWMLSKPTWDELSPKWPKAYPFILIYGDVRIQYRDQPDFEDIARQFGIFEEWKDGIPRTAYKGVVVFRYKTIRRIYLVGPNSLEQLDQECCSLLDRLSPEVQWEQPNMFQVSLHLLCWRYTISFYVPENAEIIVTGSRWKCKKLFQLLESMNQLNSN